jgi:hypothetical protein
LPSPSFQFISRDRFANCTFFSPWISSFFPIFAKLKREIANGKVDSSLSEDRLTIVFAQAAGAAQSEESSEQGLADE